MTHHTDITVERVAGKFQVRVGGLPSGGLPTQADVDLYLRAVAIGHGTAGRFTSDERKRIVARLTELGGYRLLVAMVEQAPGCDELLTD